MGFISSHPPDRHKAPAAPLHSPCPYMSGGPPPHLKPHLKREGPLAGTCWLADVLLYSINYIIHLEGNVYMALQTGMTGEATTIVVHENTAAAVGAGGVEVFGTPMMIALMENAAWGAVADELDEGYVTVGTLVNVYHLAATPLGQQVRASAELIEIDGRRLVFKVEAYDERQKIGEGRHERFIVNLERFLQRLG